MSSECDHDWTDHILPFCLIMLIFSGSFRGCLNAASEEELKDLQNQVEKLDAKIQTEIRELRETVLKEKLKHNPEPVVEDLEPVEDVIEVKSEEPLTEEEKLKREQDRLQKELDDWNNKDG